MITAFPKNRHISGLCSLLLAILTLGMAASCSSVPEVPPPSEASFGEESEAWLREAERRGVFSGYVIVGTMDGIAWQGGFGTDGNGGEPRPDQVYSIGSITKVVTGLAVLDAAVRGLLGLDDTLEKWFPGFPGGEAILLSHLLTHSSGLPETSEQPFFWFGLSRERSFEDHYRYIATARRKFSPGERFSYCNSGYVLLGRILELASGQSYAEYVRNRVSLPLGFETLAIDDGEYREDRLRGFWRLKPFAVAGLREHPSQPMAAGSAICRPIDLLRLGRSLIADSDSPAGRIGEPRKEAWEGMSYGYGIFTGTAEIEGKPRRMLWHSGGYGGFASMLSVYPDEGLVIAVLANVRHPSHWFIGEEVEAALARLYLRRAAD